MVQKYAIIVAGGKGIRMNTSIPKQFLILHNKPILFYSLQAFYNADASTKIIVVLPEEQISYWKELCQKYEITIPHTITAGGSERFYSVKNGLQHVSTNGFVAIHDGVRPLVTQKIIDEGFLVAFEKNSAVPIIDSIDSLRIINNTTNRIVDRSTIKRIQTPQIFNSTLLHEAYKAEYNTEFTDDASVFEKKNGEISVFNGDERNIKITNSYDLAIAEIFLNV